MKYSKHTKIFIGVSLFVIIIWDVFVLVEGGTQSSISHTLISWAYQFPSFPFLAGFVMGHLFWKMKDTKELKEIRGDKE